MSNKRLTMESTDWQRKSIDDIVFEGRNKSYGAFLLRRIYDKHMSRAMISGVLFFLLVISSPQIIAMIKGFLPEKKEVLTMKEVTLAEPPPIDPKKPPPPPPPEVKPPPIKEQISFVPPVVMKDEDVKDEEDPPPIDSLKDKEIAVITMKGDSSGRDVSLDEPVEISAPVLEEPKEEEPFKFVEQMPTFPNGETAMMKYLRDNIKYPNIARENNIEGRVIVQFVVSKDGDIKNAKVVRGIGGGCDQEALRVVNAMPRWVPGKHNGRSVPVTFTLPILFELQ